MNQNEQVACRIHQRNGFVSSSARQIEVNRGVQLADGLIKPTFVRSNDGRWECSQFSAFSDDTDKGSIFAQVRGSDEAGITSFRLKFNFAGAGTQSKQAMTQNAAMAIERLMPLTGAASALEPALLAGQEVGMIIDGIKLEYKQEKMDDRRFNLIGLRVRELATKSADKNRLPESSLKLSAVEAQSGPSSVR